MSTEKPAEKKSASRERSIIGKRMFLLILILSLVLCAAGGIFGMILFYRSTRRAYARAAYYLSFGMVEILYNDTIRDEIIPDFIEIYENAPEEQMYSPTYEYYALYDSIENATGTHDLEEMLAEFSQETQVSAMYLTMYDIEKERLVFIMDSRAGEDHEPAGAVMDIPADKIFRDYEKDSVAHIPYLQFDTKKYGNTIACWTVAENIDNYMIMVMVEMDMSNIMNKGLIFLGQYLLAALALALFLDTLIVYIVRKKVVTPLIDPKRMFALASSRHCHA